MTHFTTRLIFDTGSREVTIINDVASLILNSIVINIEGLRFVALFVFIKLYNNLKVAADNQYELTTEA